MPPNTTIFSGDFLYTAPIDQSSSYDRVGKNKFKKLLSFLFKKLKHITMLAGVVFDSLCKIIQIAFIATT